MTFRVIIEDGVAAPYGLAADEVLARRAGGELSRPTLRLYTYRSYAALVGRFQNPDRELDLAFCRREGVAVNRRPTGGGAIVMGEHQLGIALALPNRNRRERARELMARFSRGIATALERLGLDGGFEGKNDVEVSGRKIAGLGIYRASSGGLLFHASLLVDMDVAFMLRVLETPFEKLADKAIPAVSSRITTLRAELGRPVTIEEARRAVAKGYAEALGAPLERGELTEEELKEIDALVDEKYARDTWVFRTNEVYDRVGSSRVKTPSGLLDIEVRLAGGTIKSVRIGGDFFATESAVAAVEASLRWKRSERDAVRRALVPVYMERRDELDALPLEELTRAIAQAVRRAREPYGCFVNPRARHA